MSNHARTQVHHYRNQVTHNIDTSCGPQQLRISQKVDSVYSGRQSSCVESQAIAPLDRWPLICSFQLTQIALIVISCAFFQAALIHDTNSNFEESSLFTTREASASMIHRTDNYRVIPTQHGEARGPLYDSRRL